MNDDHATEKTDPSEEANLPPADFFDPVIEVYKKDIDRTLLRENLKLTPEERFRNFERSMRMVFELRRAVQNHRNQAAPHPTLSADPDGIGTTRGRGGMPGAE